VDGELQIAITEMQGAVYVDVTGEIDHTNNRRFAMALMEAIKLSPNTVSLDLSKVTFLGSDGIGALLRTRELAAAEGKSLRVLRASRQVERTLALVDVAHYFL
jgi:anti-anti-sigma factor